MPRNTDEVTRSSAGVQTAGSGEIRRSGARRDESLDVAKGFGIVLVVLGHCLDGLKFSGFFPPSLLWPALAVFVIYLFHMPLFFVVSGHLASGKFRPVGTTLAKLGATIVYPYFLWSIVQGLLQVYLSRYTNAPVPITALYTILWIPIIPYWFLYALFFCHVGYLFIRRLSHPVQLSIALAVFVVPLFFIVQISHAQLGVVLDITRGFLYFVLGVVTVAQVKQFGRWTAILSTGLFVVFATIYYQSQLVAGPARAGALPAAIAGIVATMAWSRMLAQSEGSLARALAGPLAFLGRYSMSIYVLHIFFTAAVRIALARAHARPTLFWTVLELGGATVAGIVLPLAINWVISKIGADKWFGIQHMTTSPS